MTILSLDYLVFVLSVLAAYYVCPLKLRWLVLLAASGVFYAWSGWQGCAYLAGASCLTWVGGLLIGELVAGQRKPAAQVTLTVTLATLLGSMAFLKYWGSLFEGGLLIPLGLSWFTFQAAWYLIEVYRNKAVAVKNPLKMLLFLGFFPQMIQGPVSTWKQLFPQLTEGHRLDPKCLTAGFTLMMWGYFKKLVLADRLALVTAYVTANELLPGWLILISPVCYMVQLYADFSGGMDVIRGTAQMLGIDMVENFRRPFFAASISDYWRRWHISLGSWFRSCLLYPFTTSRMGLALGQAAMKLLGRKAGRIVPSALATVIIFLLIGLWHGTSWNAALYGLYFGIIMAVAMFLEPTFKRTRKAMGKWDGKWFMKALRLLRTWLLVAFAQFFAFTTSTGQAFQLIGSALRNWSLSAQTALMAIMSPLEWGIALTALAVVAAVDLINERGQPLNNQLSEKSVLIRWPLLLLLIVSIVIFGKYGEGVNASAFLYTRF